MPIPRPSPTLTKAPGLITSLVRSLVTSLGPHRVRHSLCCFKHTVIALCVCLLHHTDNKKQSFLGCLHWAGQFAKCFSSIWIINVTTLWGKYHLIGEQTRAQESLSNLVTVTQWQAVQPSLKASSPTPEPPCRLAFDTLPPTNLRGPRKQTCLWRTRGTNTVLARGRFCTKVSSNEALPWKRPGHPGFREGRILQDTSSILTLSK